MFLTLLLILLLYVLQTLVKLNPKLQPMVDMIQANRSKWDELNMRRQRSQSISAASPCGVDSTEPGGGAKTKMGSSPCCSGASENTSKPVS